MPVKFFCQLQFEMRTARRFYRETVRTDVRFLNSSVFKTESELIFGFLHTLLFTNSKF